MVNHKVIVTEKPIGVTDQHMGTIQKDKNRPGTVANTCNPSTLGGQGRQIT